MHVTNLTEGAETFTCNAYLALGERNTLVDAGAMEGIVSEISRQTNSLDAIVLTHQHGDHIQQLDAVIAEFDAPVYAYAPHDHRTHELEDGDQVYIGDEVFDVIYTPGHANDHVSFVSESSLFSGDVVVHNDGAFDYGSFGRTDMPGQSREELIESIQRILDRMPDTVEHMYAGHGDVFHGDVQDVVATALSRAEKREPKYPEE